MNITVLDIKDILNSEVGRFQPKRQVCGKCDYFDSVSHAGLKCNKCGGDFVDVSKWTVLNLLSRIKKHKINGEDWMPVFVAYYLEEKDNLGFSKTYGWALDNYKLIKELYLEATKDNS